jgi:fructose-bisphosphate aldolase, class I
VSDFGKKIRLNRIFRGTDRRALVVAFDHALVLGPIEGTVNPTKQIHKFTESGIDALLLNFGILRQCYESLLQEQAPAVILRLDWTSIWTAPTGSGMKLISKLLAKPEEALRCGADAVLTYLFVGTGDREFEANEIARNAEVARECERLGIPLIVESLARGIEVKDPLAPEWMNLHTRIASELGADVIKTEYTGSPRTMADVVQTCPIPILVLGGARQKSDEDALQMVRDVVEAGAAGVFFGRNTFQASNMKQFLASARAVLDGSGVRGNKAAARASALD